MGFFGAKKFMIFFYEFFPNHINFCSKKANLYLQNVLKSIKDYVKHM